LIRQHSKAKQITDKKMKEQYDFDALSELYKADPEQFQVATRQLIDDFIASIPDDVSRRKCAGLQFKLDHELGKYADPISRMNRMVEILFDGVYQFNNALKGNIDMNENSTTSTILHMKDYKKAAAKD
jgi:hypothetical protein